MKCPKCKRIIHRYTERRNYDVIKKKVGNHTHRGLPIYKYGICPKNHYTRIQRTRVEWEPCSKCFQEEKKKKKQQYKEDYKPTLLDVPEFLRREISKHPRKYARTPPPRISRKLLHPPLNEEDDGHYPLAPPTTPTNTS